MSAEGQQAASLRCAARGELTPREQLEECCMVAEAANDAIVSCNEQGVVLFANRSAAKMFGRSGDELVGMKLELLLPELLALIGARLPELRVTGKRRRHTRKNIEIAGLHRSGMRILLEASVSDFEKNGTHTFVAVLREIGARKKSEREAERRLEFQKTVAAVSKRFITVCGIDGAINSSLADIGKLGGAGRAYLFLFNGNGRMMSNTHEWCAKGVKPQIKKLQKLPIGTFPWWMEKLRHGETIHIRDVSKLPPAAAAEKKILQMQGIKSLLVLPVHIAGELGGFMGFDNVSKTGEWSRENLEMLRICSEVLGNGIERRRAEESLRLVKLGVERSGDAIFLTDREGKITYANAAFQRIYGYGIREVLGNTPRILKSGTLPKSVYTRFWKTLLSKRIVAGEIINRRKDGSLITVEGSANPITGESGDIIGFLGIQHDITERKKAEEEQKQNYEVQRLLKELLQISVRRVPLDNVLELILEKIITIPWFKLLPKGGIFLVEDEKPDVLVLKANVNLPESLLKMCARVPFGRCLCGKAALTRKPIFASHLDKRHENRPAGIQPHGHYNIPILSSAKKVLGVLVLYVEDGHAYNEREGTALKTVMGALASAIERKTAEEALRESEAKYREIYSSSQDALMILEPPSWAFSSGNPAAIKMFRARDEKEFTSKKPYDLSPPYQPDRKPSDKKALEMINIAMKKGSNFFDWTHRKVSGEDFPATVLLTRTQLRGRTVLQATVRDITVQKKAEEALEESEERYRHLFERSNDAIFIADPKTRMLVDCNRRAEEMTGYSRKEILSMQADKLHPLDRVKETMEAFRKQAAGNRMSVESEVLTKGKKRRPVSINSAVVETRGKRQLMGVFRNITEQKKAEETIKGYASRLESEVGKRTRELREEKEKVESLSEVKDRFIRDMSHELKTPLSIILGNLQLLKDLAPIGKEKEWANLLEMLDRNSNRLTHSVNQILELSRLKETEIKKERVYLKDMLNEVHNEYLPLAKMKRLALDIDSEAAVIIGDNELIRLAVSNLVSNAIKFSEKGKVSIKLRSFDDSVLISVRDMGIGISPENQKKIFSRFFKANPSAPGTGIGLATVNEIVGKHKGKLTVKSALGKGSTFEMVLPRKVE